MSRAISILSVGVVCLNLLLIGYLVGTKVQRVERKCNNIVRYDDLLVCEIYINAEDDVI